MISPRVQLRVVSEDGEPIAGLFVQVGERREVTDRLGRLAAINDTSDEITVSDRTNAELDYSRTEFEDGPSLLTVPRDELTDHLQRPVIADEIVNFTRPLALAGLVDASEDFARIPLCNPWLEVVTFDAVNRAYMGDPDAVAGITQAIEVAAPSHSGYSMLAASPSVAIGALYRAIPEQDRLLDAVTRLSLVHILANRAIGDWMIERESSFDSIRHRALGELICDPDLPPLPLDPDLPIPPWPFDLDPVELDTIECARKLLRAAEQNLSTYDVSAISPEFACPGSEVTIEGSGFGEMAGDVRIGGQSVEVATWSDSEIVLIVPNAPVFGTVWIEVPGRAEYICDELVEFPATAQSLTTYVGGLPFVRLSVPATVLPGEPVAVSWATPFTNGAVTLTNPDATVNVAHVGTVNYLNTQTTSTREITFSVTVSNPCGSSTATSNVLIHRPSQVRLSDIEVTQGVQFFNAGMANHLVGTQWANAPDNSMRLIPNKATLARVYVESDQDPSFNGGRALDIDVRAYVLPNGTPPGTFIGTVRLDPMADTSVSTVAARRGSSTASANFVVPSQFLDGTPFTLRAFASDTESPDTVDNSQASSSTDVLQYRFDTRPIRLVPIGITLTNPALSATGTNYASPMARAQLAVAMQQALASRLPTENVEIWGALPRHGLITFGGNITTQGGFQQLHDRIADIADEYASGDWMFLGIVNWTMANPPPSQILGLAGSRALVIFWPGGPGWGAEVAAHEIMHLRGVDPSNTGHIDGSDSQFPRNAYGYGVLATNAAGAQIRSAGEFGVDVETFVANSGQLGIFPPATTPGLMNPGSVFGFGSRWTSPYTWLFQGWTLAGGAGPYELPEADVLQLHVRGTINDSTGRVDFPTPYSMVRPRRLDRRYGPESGFTVVGFVDGEQVAFTHPIRWQSPDSVGTLRVDELIPLSDLELSRLEIRSPDGSTLKRWTSTQTPDVELLLEDQRENQFTLRASLSEGLQHSLWISFNGHVWRKLHSEIDADGKVVLADTAPGGTIRLVGTDGARSAIGEVRLPGPSSEETPWITVSTISHGEWTRATAHLDDLLTVSETEPSIDWRVGERSVSRGRVCTVRAEELGDLTVAVGEGPAIAVISLLESAD